MADRIPNLTLTTPPLSLAASDASTYSDLNGLAALKSDPHSPQALHLVAEQVDALFLQMMLKSMREASAEIGDSASNELGMYQDLFDKQISLTMSERGGLGVGAMMARQLAGQAPGSTPAQPQSAPPPPAVSPGASAPRIAPAATIGQNAAEFIGRILPTIRSAAAALGLNPVGMLAQAALETGWGRRMARTTSGAPSLNLFGIKADDQWSGARATAATLEFAGGVATPRRAAFRAYDSVEDSVRDFAKLLQDSPRYRGVIAAGKDLQGYIAGIAKSAYATDPDYANKLNEIVASGTFRSALRVAGALL